MEIAIKVVYCFLDMKSKNICPFELEPSWKRVLEDEIQKPYIAKLAAFVENERAKGFTVYPPKELVLNAFWKTPYDKVKVLIMGQDPYHGPGQAHGLSFSVPKGVPMPPSLQNIFKELNNDVGINIPTQGCLIPWTEQGVMLLNATLTVRQSDPLSHHGRGWEQFTDAVIAKLADRKDPVIFVLWGKNAQEKCHHIGQLKGKTQHVVLTASHPSPFSVNRGFFGCCHFSKIDEILKKCGKEPIDWNLA